MPKESGTVLITDPDSDAVVTAFTLQCRHCGQHWIPAPGSGRVRGFCQNCNGPICGPGCQKCVPVEQMLENIEKGRPEDFKPIVVPTWG